MRYYGYRPSRKDSRDFLRTPATSQQVALLPPSVDWRSVDPMVWDQGALGSCVSNATIAMHHFVQIKEGLTPILGSRLQNYYNARVLEGTPSWDSGLMPRDALASLHHDGVAPENEWPYDLSKYTDAPPASVVADGLKSVALRYESVGFGVPYTDINQLKAVLAAGDPFLFGFNVYTQFDGVGADGNIEMPGPDNFTLRGGHCCLVVGYDDTHRTGDFLLKNSWGTGWGMGGFAWMPYDYVKFDSGADAWTLSVVGGATMRPAAIAARAAIADMDTDLRNLEGALTKLEAK